MRKSPASPDVRALYFFYMHSRRVQMNVQSDHRGHGLDDCADIIFKLAEHGLVIFGKLRPNDTRILEFAEKIAA